MSWHKYGMSPNGSKLEKAVGEILYLRERAGELRDVQEQVKVRICCDNPDCPSNMRIHSIIDFSAFDVKKEKTIYIEAKGFETSDYRIKRRLWLHNGPSDMEVWKGDYRRPKLSEII